MEIWSIFQVLLKEIANTKTCQVIKFTFSWQCNWVILKLLPKFISFIKNFGKIVKQFYKNMSDDCLKSLRVIHCFYLSNASENIIDLVENEFEHNIYRKFYTTITENG